MKQNENEVVKLTIKLRQVKKNLQIKSWKTLARLNAKSIYKSEICTAQLKLTKN